MVGYRNFCLRMAARPADFIRHSDGGVSEQTLESCLAEFGLYQAFRWWGIGTAPRRTCRCRTDFIRHSDGGVSERRRAQPHCRIGLYQAFRWWGIGTSDVIGVVEPGTLSGIPMVGYRNAFECRRCAASDFIRHSDGGVSERCEQCLSWWT